MNICVPHSWPSTVEEAIAIQDRLRPLVSIDEKTPNISTVAGVDVAYAKDSDRLAAAVVVLNALTLETVDSAIAVGITAFPYTPGLFAFRELPAIVQALEQLSTQPDLLVCDGQGIAHPRHFGLACHLGVITELPAIGVGKTALIGSAVEPEYERGAWTTLVDNGETIGRVLRTQNGVKPVIVSIGNLINIDNACQIVLGLCSRYRLPETTRQADQLSRIALADIKA